MSNILYFVSFLLDNNLKSQYADDMKKDPKILLMYNLYLLNFEMFFKWEMSVSLLQVRVLDKWWFIHQLRITSRRQLEKNGIHGDRMNEATNIASQKSHARLLWMDKTALCTISNNKKNRRKKWNEHISDPSKFMLFYVFHFWTKHFWRCVLVLTFKFLRF